MERLGEKGIPQGFGPCVVTIGNFDGVHLGHQAVLRRVVEDARATNRLSVVVTFDPHPLAVHRPEACPELIQPLADRIEAIGACGIDAVWVIRYDLAFASLSPRDFVTRYLTEPLAMREMVVGHDLRFGRDNSGDVTTLRQLGDELGFEVVVLPDVGNEAFGRPRWSSTLVRELLAAGDVDKAAEVLGRPHRVRGSVVHGDARGRDLGFPTANLGDDTEGIVPADGIYAGWLHRLALSPGDPERVLPAAISIGTNPTFAGGSRRVEAHVPWRTDLDLYDETIALDFVARLRHTLRFESVEALVEQMSDDVAGAVRTLAASSSA